jgi:hypothetical protein
MIRKFSTNERFPTLKKINTGKKMCADNYVLFFSTFEEHNRR